MDFTGKVVLISGATRGIGRSIAEMLSMYGATVIGTSTSKLGAESISSYLGAHGMGMELNVTIQDSITNLIRAIKLKFSSVDVLINNAGIVQDNILMNIQDAEWLKIIDTNLTSIYRMSKAVIRSMIKKRYGRIITIGSLIGSVGNVGQTSYAASKAGLVGFCKSLAREVAAWGITVNIVSPGFIETDMTLKLTQEHRVNILSKIPMNRFGTSEDVAGAVVFLASDAASYITGETIHINGGMFMS